MAPENLYCGTRCGVSEDHSSSVWVSGSQKDVWVEIDELVEHLRIDLGECEGENFSVEKIIINPSMFERIKSVVFNMSSIRIILIFLFLLILIFAGSDCKTFLSWTCHYRWILGIIIITICTLLKLHGSSLGALYDGVKIPGKDFSLLFGTPRPIRSDEYVVFTQMSLSQVQSGFPWYSDIWGYSPTDMFLIYGQPIRNIITLYRPFTLGYLLFGAEYGLAFYWSAREVVLFLSSFEFGLLITRKNKTISLLYAVIVAFAPLVQWWFSTNELVEMLIFGQFDVVLFDRFFRSDRLLSKVLMTIGAILCTGGFILSMYPAWIVPLFYVFLAAGFSVAVENHKGWKCRKSDAIFFGIGAIVLVGSMLYVLNKSSMAFTAAMNSSYPGQRRITGGDLSAWPRLFKGWIGFLLPFIDIPNPCEEAAFLDFFPLGLLLSGYLIFKGKRKDVWLISLNVLDLILLLYCLFKIPIIAKISLLTWTKPTRAEDILSLVNLLIFVRIIAIYRFRFPIIVGTILGLFVTFGVVQTGRSYLSPTTNTLVAGLVLLIIWLSILKLNEKVHITFLTVILFLSIIGGCTVNPVSSGLSGIYTNPLIQQIEKIDKQNRGLWAVVCADPLRLNNLPALVGAKTMNAVATYPEYSLWEKLGLHDEKEIWNRYAHIDIQLYSEEPVSLELIRADHIRLHTNLEKLRQVGVEYLLTKEEIPESTAVQLYSYMGYYIYQI